MKILKTVGCWLTLAAALLSGCNNDSGGHQNSTSNQLTLSVNKTNIMPDGRDKATFTVMLGSEDVTASSSISDQNGNSVSASTFSSKTEGDFTFTAYYTDNNGIEHQSNTVTVTVSGSLILVANQETISVGESVSFALYYHDIDMVASASIKNLTLNETLDSNLFIAPGYTGTFEFQATYSGMTSNVVTVTVEPAKVYAVRLLQSKARVQDGEQVDFQVLFEGNDVTSSAKIFNISSGEQLSGNSYTYSGRGTIQFQAEYDGQKSQIVNVSSVNFYKKVLTLKFTSVLCGNCVQTTIALDNANRQLPDRMVQIACYTPAQGDDELALPEIMNMTSYFSKNSYLPSTYYDYDDLHAGVTGNSEVLAKIKSKASNIPGAGIAASSIVNGSNIDIKVDVTAVRERQYYLAVLVLEDGIVAPQASGSEDYIHNHVLRGIVTNEQSLFGDDLGLMSVNQQISKEYSVKLDAYNAASCSLACFVLYKDNNVWHVTNAINVPMYNGIVNYRFEA